ncbi:MAG: helix-turn-helix domain-containing protein, partial [Tumebacillaceae bacterium]
MGTDQHATIGQRVKKQRKDRGLSQAELAEGICSSSTISLLETDQHVPSAEILQKLAEKLGVPLQEIVHGSGSDLDIALQLDIIEILVEAEEFAEALPMIHELEQRDGVVEYQRRSLVLLQAECLMRTGEAERAVELLTALQQQLEQHREPDSRFMALFYNKLGSAYYFASNMV